MRWDIGTAARHSGPGGGCSGVPAPQPNACARQHLPARCRWLCRGSASVAGAVPGGEMKAGCKQEPWLPAGEALPAPAAERGEQLQRRGRREQAEPRREGERAQSWVSG